MTTVATGHVEPATPGRADGPRATLWLLRAMLVGHAAAAVAQPILAGRYLSGDFDALGVHSANAGFVILFDMAAFGAAILYWLFGRGRGWPALALAGLYVLEIAQVVAGTNRALSIHIPLGVLIVGLAVWMAAWSFRPAARRTRPRRQPAAGAGAGR